MAEEDMKNSADQGGCYPPRPMGEVDNTLWVLQNYSYPTKAEFNDCFIIIQNIFKLLKKKMSSLFFCSPKNNTTLSPWEGYLTKLNTGRLCPKVQPLPFCIPFWQKIKVPLYTFYWKKVPLSHTYFRKSCSHFHVVLNQGAKKINFTACPSGLASFIHYNKKQPKVLNRHTKWQRRQREKFSVKALHSAICRQKISHRSIS